MNSDIPENFQPLITKWSWSNLAFFVFLGALILYGEIWAWRLYLNADHAIFSHEAALLIPSGMVIFDLVFLFLAAAILQYPLLCVRGIPLIEMDVNGLAIGGIHVDWKNVQSFKYERYLAPRGGGGYRFAIQLDGIKLRNSFFVKSDLIHLNADLIEDNGVNVASYALALSIKASQAQR